LVRESNTFAGKGICLFFALNFIVIFVYFACSLLVLH